jgi:hypothetical protein
MPGLNDFLLRIQTDYALYLQFRRSPQEALASYELSSEERAALSESGSPLWERLAGMMHHTLSQSNHYLQLEGDSEFSRAKALAGSQVQQTVAQIHCANTHTDRLAAVSTLMEQIG